MKKIILKATLAFLLAVPVIAQSATYKVCTSTNDCVDSKINPVVERDVGELKDYAKTFYPLVLVHGINGYAERDWQSNNNEYWPSVPKALFAGGADVYVTTVAAFDSPVKRGEQLFERIRDIQAISGAAKINLIAHSQGAQTARYVAAIKPQYVASVTSIAGTNKGTPIASLPIATASLLISWLFNPFYDSVVDREEYKQHLYKDLIMLSPIGAANFNARYPQAVPKSKCGEGDYVVNGVAYYSWGGVKGSPFTAPFFGLGIFNDNANDTIVPRCSTHLGKVIRDNYDLNHVQLVNRSTTPQHGVLAIYRKHANYLKIQGY